MLGWVRGCLECGRDGLLYVRDNLSYLEKSYVVYVNMDFSC